MPRRCDSYVLPEHYIGPTRRPSSHQTGTETAAEVAWDVMSGHWPTTAEWLAWVRRRDGGKRLFSGRGWHYPVRPIIAAHRLPWTTRRIRRLP